MRLDLTIENHPEYSIRVTGLPSNHLTLKVGHLYTIGKFAVFWIKDPTFPDKTREINFISDNTLSHENHQNRLPLLYTGLAGEIEYRNFYILQFLIGTKVRWIDSFNLVELTPILTPQII